MTTPNRFLLAIIAFIGWFALVTQFCLTLTNQLSDLSEGERVLRFFSYFTALTNLLVAIASTSLGFFPATRAGRFFSSASAQAAVATYISIVAIIYSLFLRGSWDPLSLHGLNDTLFHDIIPIAYVLQWILFSPKNGLRLFDPIIWLIYPVAYISSTLIHGAATNWYPYWFADVSKLGYPVALRNTGFILIAFVTVGFVFLTFSKLLARRSRWGVYR